MKTLLALLLLIPSLSWGKDLSGTKLFCKTSTPCTQGGKGLCEPEYFLEFRKNNKVYFWEVSRFGLDKTTLNYEVKPSKILINYTFLQQKITAQSGKTKKTIDRVTLNGCKFINNSNMDLLVNDYYQKHYQSHNKL